MKFCRECGNEILEMAAICPKCGCKTNGSLDPGKGKVCKKSTAALLAFFLGGLGVHKFYEGKIGIGILYLLFCWTYIPGLIAIIDIIVILCKSGDEYYA